MYNYKGVSPSNIYGCVCVCACVCVDGYKNELFEWLSWAALTANETVVQ